MSEEAPDIPCRRWDWDSFPAWNNGGASGDYPVDAHADANRRWPVFEAEAMPHVERLFRHAMWLERDRVDAEDLVQETLVQALQSFHRFTPGTNCRAWLVTILHHVRANRRRKAARAALDLALDDPIADTVPFVPPVPDRLTDEDVLRALRELPAPHQDAILLCDIEDLTYREAAEALGVPVGTVMSRLHRARARLRVELARAGAVPAAAAERAGTA